MTRATRSEIAVAEAATKVATPTNSKTSLRPFILTNNSDSSEQDKPGGEKYVILRIAEADGFVRRTQRNLSYRAAAGFPDSIERCPHSTERDPKARKGESVTWTTVRF